MKYPKHDVYEKLYEKYLDPESLKILMDLAGDMKNKQILDLCCGTGICTKEALVREAHHVTMVDEERDMIPAIFFYSGKTTVYDNPIKTSLISLKKDYQYFDVAICRQGINYWFNSEIIYLLADVIRTGGVFVFNTFNTRPSETPKIKQYHHKNVSFTEISYVDPTNMVHHVQIREGMAPHVARFQWIAPESFDLFLGGHFNIEKMTRNRTDYYKCVRK